MSQHSNIRASLFSLELKSWSTKSSSYRIFRVSKYATNISENACSRWSTSTIDFLSIRITEQSVIAVAEHSRRGCPVRQPSPKKSPLFRMPIVASFPIFDTTVRFTFPFFILKTASPESPCAKIVRFLGKSSIFLPPLMVERNVLGSNLLSFLDTATSVIIGPFLKVSELRRRQVPIVKEE